jgi:DNA-binding transcriptional regulator GbsR (MarR family)
MNKIEPLNQRSYKAIHDKIQELVEAVNDLREGFYNEKLCQEVLKKPSTIAERLEDVDTNQCDYYKALASEAKRFFKELCKECIRYPLAMDNFVHIDELLRRIEEA